VCTYTSSPSADATRSGQLCERSITLCHTVIGAGLVDEYRLFVYPVVQGRGRRLFPDGFRCPKLRLLEAKAFRSGITYARYAPS
jgi:dihydrofolate reductase